MVKRREKLVGRRLGIRGNGEFMYFDTRPCRWSGRAVRPENTGYHARRIDIRQSPNGWRVLLQYAPETYEGLLEAFAEDTRIRVLVVTMVDEKEPYDGMQLSNITRCRHSKVPSQGGVTIEQLEILAATASPISRHQHKAMGWVVEP